ncbi:hypothetical protein EYF80_016017 [Liparis tanakae]|uniref:Uncharacterized protein n=1 Tax=Liparis tanakae TaxID=230148 RepID=A0A4Z2I6X1_9TELE|nr:hypothetical protein EYF80_016017 [Liparis tanakae]
MVSKAMSGVKRPVLPDRERTGHRAKGKRRTVERKTEGGRRHKWYTDSGSQNTIATENASLTTHHKDSLETLAVELGPRLDNGKDSKRERVLLLMMDVVFTCGTVHQLQNQRPTSHNARTTGKEIPVRQKAKKMQLAKLNYSILLLGLGPSHENLIQRFSSTELFPALWPPTTAIWGRSRFAFCPMAEKASCMRFT